MNFATSLKTEISRVARKEVKADTKGLKKTSSQYRSDIAALKRRVADLERLVRQLGKATLKAKLTPRPEDEGTTIRFNAKGFASQLARLGLSAAQMGLLLGVSDQSVNKWAVGKAKPRAMHLPAIAAVRKMGKREAAARLAELAA
jgi:hypothetical protein